MPQFFLHFAIAAIFTMSLSALTTFPAEVSSAAPLAADRPAKEALDHFAAGRHAAAIELARPLAEQGDADAHILKKLLKDDALTGDLTSKFR